MSTSRRSVGNEAPGVLHPRAFAPATFVLVLALSVLGAIIGLQLLVTLGVTPNTSLVGALVAIALARVPFGVFRRYRSIHVQNLAQSAISAATFGAANSLLLPIGVPWILGRPDLILPMFAGVGCAMLLDAYLLYRMFGTSVFPAGPRGRRESRRARRSVPATRAAARRASWGSAWAWASPEAGLAFRCRPLELLSSATSPRSRCSASACWCAATPRRCSPDPCSRRCFPTAMSAARCCRTAS